MGAISRLGNELYTGRRSVDFVGRWWLWAAISAVVVIVAALGLTTKGLNLGLEFKGGTQYTISVPTSQVTQTNVDKLRTVVAGSGVPGTSQPQVTTSGDQALLVTTEKLDQTQNDKVIGEMASAMHVNAQQDISPDSVGASWGSQVANKALTGLVVFLVLVMLFIWAYFRQWKMSVGAVVALAHDIVITAGIYAWSGFQVSPATVTGFLTILGFSLYDTVVVYDKVRENTKNLRRSRRTYSEQANLAVNQTLVRSINTTIVALLPVAALLYVSVTSLGAGDLQDLSLALFVGMGSGMYSSIFIATPLVAQLKSREREISEQDRRAKARQRREADRYANVPTLKGEDGVAAPPPAYADTSDGAYELGEDAPDATPRGEDEGRSGRPPVAPPRRPERTGTGRVLPQPKSPVRESGASKRNQPSRQPRSRRGK
ncbi:MAG: protein translocase subunit SecF [Marmoricola sp.]